jgi:hypothetical protein
VEVALVRTDVGGSSGGGGGGGAAGEDRIEGTATDLKNGTYACSITATTDEGQWALEVRVGGVQIQGSPFAVEVSAGREFVYSGTPFDTNGVLYWIGTGEGTRAYANPHGKDGGVVAAMSSIQDGHGAAPRFIQHAVDCQAGGYSGYNISGSIDNSWMSVDLGPARRLAVDHYCLRHDQNAGYPLQNWRLEGSNDTTTWIALKTHTDDRALATTAHSTAAWPVTPPTAEKFRHFRVLQFGKNAFGDNRMHCAGIELYGTLLNSA